MGKEKLSLGDYMNIIEQRQKDNEYRYRRIGYLQCKWTRKYIDTRQSDKDIQNEITSELAKALDNERVIAESWKAIRNRRMHG